VTSGHDHESSRLAWDHERRLPVIEHEQRRLGARVEEVAKNAHAARDLAAAATAHGAAMDDAVTELRAAFRDLRRELKDDVKAQLDAVRSEMNRRHDRTDDTLRWLGRLVIGAVVAAVLGLVLIDPPRLMELIRAAKAATLG